MITVKINNTQNLNKEEKKEMIKNDITKNVVPATAISTAWVAVEGIGKDRIKADSFIKTAKNCAKEYSKNNKEFLKDCFKFFKLENLNQYIDKIGNKTFFAGAFVASILLNIAVISGINQIFQKNNKTK